MKQKGNVDSSVVRRAMLYGAEPCATTKGHEPRLEINETRIRSDKEGYDPKYTH